MSAAPREPACSMRGRLWPPPEVSWRTRRETKLTKTLGFPTLANACFVYSLFKAQQANGRRFESKQKVAGL